MDTDADAEGTRLLFQVAFEASMFSETFGTDTRVQDVNAAKIKELWQKEKADTMFTRSNLMIYFTAWFSKIIDAFNNPTLELYRCVHVSCY